VQVELLQQDLQVVPEELHQLLQVFTAALERTVLQIISLARRIITAAAAQADHMTTAQ
jgi:Mor family transcriptional regulator